MLSWVCLVCGDDAEYSDGGVKLCARCWDKHVVRKVAGEVT